jgi:hypothetical protein
MAKTSDREKEERLRGPHSENEREERGAALCCLQVAEDVSLLHIHERVECSFDAVACFIVVLLPLYCRCHWGWQAVCFNWAGRQVSGRVILLCFLKGKQLFVSMFFRC